MLDIIDFRVIGELKANPHTLLLLGDDGRYYAFDLVRGETVPMEPDDSWAVDLIDERSLRIELPADTP